MFKVALFLNILLISENRKLIYTGVGILKHNSVTNIVRSINIRRYLPAINYLKKKKRSSITEYTYYVSVKTI